MQIPARMTAAAITGAAKAITGARSVWLGCNPVPVQRIYFANHSSHSDFVLLWAALPPLLRKRTRPVAGADYWSKGTLRPYVIHQVFNGVLVERSSNAKADPPSSATSDGDAPFTAAAPAPADRIPEPFSEAQAADLLTDFAWREREPSAQADQQDDAAMAAWHANGKTDNESLNSWEEAEPVRPDFLAAAPPESTDRSGHAPSPAERPCASHKPDALAPLKAALEAGDSLILFPEGTRNMQEGLLPFKSGIYHLAKAFPHVEIVPVWLGNLNRVMPKGALIPLPLLCTVSFGTPLQVQTGESKEGFLSRARNALLQLAGSEGETPPAATPHNDTERTAP